MPHITIETNYIKIKLDKKWKGSLNTFSLSRESENEDPLKSLLLI